MRRTFDADDAQAGVDQVAWIHQGLWIVDDSTRPKKWTFENAVLGLFSRFVHQSTTLQATQRFENVRYVKGEGVAGLVNELLKWADRMVVYPDEYTIRRSFYKALPPRISLIMGPT